MSMDVYINEGTPTPGDIVIGKVAHAETCLFWRCARRVINDGNPAGESVILCAPTAENARHPLCALTVTKANRLICWPALPRHIAADATDKHIQLIDHITLELRSRNAHSSGYKPDGFKLPTVLKWKPHPFPDHNVSFWFGLVIGRHAIESQILQDNMWLRFPSKDTKRRLNEYSRLFQQTQFVNANAGPDLGGQALVAFFYLVDGSPVEISERILPALEEKAGILQLDPEDPPTENLATTGFVVGGVQMGVVLGWLRCFLLNDGPFVLPPRTKKPTGPTRRVA